MNRRYTRLFTIIAAVILTVGIVALFVGGLISGWDFIAWLSSTDAMWVYILVGIFILALLSMLVLGWVNK